MNRRLLFLLICATAAVAQPQLVRRETEFRVRPGHTFDRGVLRAQPVRLDVTALAAPAPLNAAGRPEERVREAFAPAIARMQLHLFDDVVLPIRWNRMEELKAS